MTAVHFGRLEHVPLREIRRDEAATFRPPVDGRVLDLLGSEATMAGDPRGLRKRISWPLTLRATGLGPLEATTVGSQVGCPCGYYLLVMSWPHRTERPYAVPGAAEVPFGFRLGVIP